MTASFADHEIWHVLIAHDDMKRMNVEQLDDAFRLSLVDASTLVWKAGMKTWQSLGVVAGIDDEPVAPPIHRAPPPPPPPRPAPRAVAPVAFHTAIAPVFSAPALVAPVYTPALRAPDPYVLPKRRVQIPSEVDFRRSSGGIRWGRWLLALLLLTTGTLGAYRQNLLREGARRLGVEGKYLYGERRAVAFVTAKAPPQLKSVLTRLALLPGPNALPEPAHPRVAQAVATVSPIATVADPARPSADTSGEPDVKTVSLESLPVLTAEPEIAKAPVAPAPATSPLHAKTASQPAIPRAAARPAKSSTRAEKPEIAHRPAPPIETKATPEPKPKAEPPPPANEGFLKAAIRSAIAADKKK